MARRRDLRPEEAELWQAVARTARPMHAGQVYHRATPKPEPAPARDQIAPAPTEPGLNRFRVGERVGAKPVIDVQPGTADRLSSAPVLMDAKHHGRMIRGKLVPEARIDLHGLTLAEAHPELIRFILNAQSQGLRLVLVITGKGKRGLDIGPSPQRMGALRHQVPQWLRLAPLGQSVLQVTEAHLKHGGSGAYYIYLRRR